MSNLEIPPFDLLKGQNAPFEGFGDILPKSLSNNNLLIGLISQATIRIEEDFEIGQGDAIKFVAELENIIDEMWQDGWDPQKGDVNLFTTDFGLILTKTIIDLYGGEFIFRSKTNLNHFSIWWVEKGIEVFPFHKMYKRLIYLSGENLSSFIQGLQEVLA